MKELFIKLISDPLGVALLLLPLSILAKNLIGAAHSAQTNSFNWNYLKRGLFKGMLIYLGIGVVVLMSLLSNDLTITINEKSYSLIQGIVVIVRGVATVYIIDFFKTLQSIWKTPTTEAIDIDNVKKQNDGTYSHREEKK